MSKKIELTQGQFAIVDDADFDWLNQWKWYADKRKGTFYAARNTPKTNGEREKIYMHHLILNPPSGMMSDHRNNDGLDNRRSNLRSCTRNQNAMNQNKQAGCSSHYKGVSWYKAADKWQAKLEHNGVQYHFGFFDDEVVAARAYDVGAYKYFSEFAKPNFLEGA